MNKIMIIGGGVSGKGAAELAWALQREYLVVNDNDTADCSLPELFAGVDLAVVSPGVLPQSRLLQYAVQNVPEVISELEFGIRHFPGRMAAVTGTNGKTTTVELTEFLLKKLGGKVQAAGNIGLPLSAVSAGMLKNNQLDPDFIAVLEVSSFQLEHTTRLPAECAVLLNVESDHINRYPGGMAEYRAVKERIFSDVVPEKRFYGISMTGSRSSGNFELHGNMLFYKEKPVTDLTGSCFESQHNQENLLAALSLTECMVAVEDKLELIAAAILEFKTGDHRISQVAEINGVRYIDDSKATNPAAVKAAVYALEKTPRGNIVLIAGGLDKDMDFSPLAELSAYLRKVVVYGRCGKLVAAAFGDKVEIFDAGSDFSLAVKTASACAVAGDTVLLSPAAASMDMFKDYKERGNEFARLVRTLTEDVRR